MKIIDDSLIDRICVDDVVIISGIRPADRVIDRSKNERPWHGLLYIWSGRVTFSIKNRKCMDFNDGELVYIPKHTKYRMRYSKDNTTFVVVNFDMFTKSGEEPAISDCITSVGKEDAAHSIANIMSKFELCGSSQNFSAHFRRKELLYRMLSLIYNIEHTENAQRHTQILPGVIFLKQSYLENIPIDTFAKMSNMSITSFRTMFKEQYNMSPLQYRNRLRINRARELLEEGGCTVAEAAYASGFDNIGYFCRYYKKITGLTPSSTNKNV